MKKRSFAACLLCLLLLTSCGTRGKEETESAFENASAPDASGFIQEIPAEAAALLDAILAEESENSLAFLREDGDLEWIASDRIGEVRAQVEAIGKPFLTEERAMMIARRIASFYCEAAERGITVVSPEFGRVAELRLGTRNRPYEAHLANCDALFAYTVYLLTPPEYLFNSMEAGFLTSHDAEKNEFDIYPMLAGNYASRPDALKALQEENHCVLLHMNSSVLKERTVNFSFYLRSCSLLAGEEAPIDMAGVEASAAPVFQHLLAQTQIKALLTAFTTSNSYTFPAYSRYEKGKKYYVAAPADTVAEILEARALLDAPILTESAAEAIIENVKFLYVYGTAAILPATDGGEDTLLEPEEFGRFAVQDAICEYYFALFTPPAYCFTDLFNLPGRFYPLCRTHDLPSETLAALEAGELRFVWFDANDNRGCIVDSDGEVLSWL